MRKTTLTIPSSFANPPRTPYVIHAFGRFYWLLVGYREELAQDPRNLLPFLHLVSVLPFPTDYFSTPYPNSEGLPTFLTSYSNLPSVLSLNSQLHLPQAQQNKKPSTSGNCHDLKGSFNRCLTVCACVCQENQLRACQPGHPLAPLMVTMVSERERESLVPITCMPA